jgi:hypothetical protein
MSYVSQLRSTLRPVDIFLWLSTHVTEPMVS